MAEGGWAGNPTQQPLRTVGVAVDDPVEGPVGFEPVQDVPMVEMTYVKA